MVMLQRVDRQAAGIYTVYDVDGNLLFQSGIRQCVHCQFGWVHEPGSGQVRGFCFNCKGHLCGKPTCATCYHHEKRLDDADAVARGNRAAIEAAVRRQQLREQVYQYLKKKRRIGEDRRLRSR